jgi:antitoxin MazE
MDIHWISESELAMRTTIARWGNSTALRLPKVVVEELNLKPGQQVEVIVEGGEARLKPVRRPRPTLEELMAEADRIGWENQPPLVDWGPDVGAEIIDDEYSRGEIVPGPDGYPRRKTTDGRS